MNRLFFALLVGFTLPALAGDGGTIFGTWSFDPARSTDLAIWKSLSPRLEITGTEGALTIRTLWMEGKQARWIDSVTVHPGADATATRTTSAIWPDNWYMGVLAKKGSSQTSVAHWRTPGRALDFTSTRVVEVSQGEATIVTAREMQVDSTGAVLTVTERRSSRRTPLTLVFQRAVAP